MAQNRTDNFNITAPKSIDNRFLKNGTTVYASTVEAHSLISYKHIGLTVLVDKGGVPTEYHYKTSTASENDLIEKIVMNINSAYTVSQLRNLDTTTNNVYTSSNLGKGTWIDLGLNDGVYEDDGATHIITANNHALERVISESINVLWFGADPTNTTDSLSAFDNAVIVARAWRFNIFIPKGRYKFSAPWIIPGRSNASAVLINGDGARNSILDFSTASGTICVQYGTPDSNTIHGGLGNVQIQGTSTKHGLVISSHAPYSCAFNTFENIYFFKVKDGITFDGLSSNTSSNYQNFFYNMMVEEHWGRGIYCDGAMNVFDGGFIVAPYGTHGTPEAGTGAESLAVHDYGGGNTYNNIPSEDQWLFNGSNTKVTRCTTELVQKAVPNSSAGDAVIRIGGGGVSIDGFTITTVPNTVIGAMMYIYGQGTTLKNIVYLNPGDIPLYRITYPCLPSGGSSGTMENVNTPTSYGVNNSAFDTSTVNWSFINVLGNGGTYFSKIANLDSGVDTSDFLSKSSGGSITGYVSIADALISNSIELHGYVYHNGVSHVIRNKANDAWLALMATNTTGSETVIDISNIGTLQAKGNITTTGNVIGATATSPEHLVTKAQLDAITSGGSSNALDKTAGGTVTGYTNFADMNVTNSIELHGVVYDYSGGHYMQNKALDNILPIMARDTSGSEAVLNLNNIGKINSNGNPVTIEGPLSSAQLNVNGGPGTNTIAKILPNGIDGNNGGLTLQYQSLSTYHDGLVLDRFGDVTVTGKVKSTQFKLSALNTAPSSATDTGTTGEIRIAADYIYVCIATNTWVRTPLSTW